MRFAPPKPLASTLRGRLTLPRGEDRPGPKVVDVGDPVRAASRSFPHEVSAGRIALRLSPGLLSLKDVLKFNHVPLPAAAPVITRPASTPRCGHRSAPGKPPPP